MHPVVPSRSENIGRPAFQNRLYLLAKLVRECSIYEAVIECEGQVSLRADSDGVPIDHCRYFLDGADSKNRHLRLVDHGGGKDTAEAAEVGDGERTALNL